MESTFLKTTLRELKVFTGSARFWATFLAIVLLFAMTGPYGTGTKMTFGPRLGYWFVIHAATWSLAIGCIVVFDVVFKARIRNQYIRILGGALLSSIPIGIAVEYITSQWTGDLPDLTSIAFAIINALPLTLVFSLITFMTMGTALKDSRQDRDEVATENRQSGEQPDSTGAASAQDAVSTPSTAPPLLMRLKPENRGPLLLMSVEDHYVHVTTTRGHELILLRFSDALKEVGQTEGAQVHRSHWVAKAYIDALKRENGKISLVLKNGQMIPVSKPYAEAARALLA